jgi:hypothetical protein
VSYDLERSEAALRPDLEEVREELLLDPLDLPLASVWTVDTDTDLLVGVRTREFRADPELARAGLKDLEERHL